MYYCIYLLYLYLLCVLLCSIETIIVSLCANRTQNSELRTQKFIQHNTRVKNVQQCYCIKIIRYFNYVIFMYYVMEIEQRLFNR